MSDVSTQSNARPRPVVIYAAITASLAAFLSYAGLADLMPAKAIAVIGLVNVVVIAGGAVLVQGLTTPLASPRDARGVDLKPVDVVEAEKAQVRADAILEAVVTPPPAGPRQPGEPA
jgi:hypothetical protein